MFLMKKNKFKGSFIALLYLCKRKTDFRHVNGKDYGAFTLRLNDKKFEEI